MAEPTTEAAPKLMPAAVGIRLGACTLTLAVSRLGAGFEPLPSVVAGDSGERTTPAAVAFSNGEWVMGEAALQSKAKNPKSFFSNLLPLVGTKVSDAVLAKLTKGVKASKQGDGQVLLQPCNPSGETEGSPKLAGEMLTMLLEWFKRLAEENAGGLVGPCVLTTPAWCSDEQKAAVAACGAAAGFDVLQVLSEPTAVAIAHRADEASVDGATGSLKRCVVVDLGASGLDVAVMTVNRGVISVDAHEHTDALSGALLVNALAAFGAKIFAKKCGGVDPLASAKSSAKLHAACESAMRFLSAASDVNLEVESLCEGMDLRQRVSRARFEDLCGDLWAEIDGTLDKALAAAGIDRSKVDCTFVAGGASRVPKFIARLNSLVPESAAAEGLTVPPDEGAALGAARQAALLVWDEFQGFRADYKKDATKLHEIVPKHTTVACLPSGLALTAKGCTVQLLSPNAALPIHHHLLVTPMDSLGGGASGETLAVTLVEVGPDVGDAEAAKLATFTFDKLAAAPESLAATLAVTATGEVSLTVRVLSGKETMKSKVAAGTEIAVKIPAP